MGVKNAEMTAPVGSALRAASLRVSSACPLFSNSAVPKTVATVEAAVVVVVPELTVYWNVTVPDAPAVG